MKFRSLTSKLLATSLCVAMLASFASCSSSDSSSDTSSDSSSDTSSSDTSADDTAADDSTASDEAVVIWTTLSQEEMNGYEEQFHLYYPDIELDITVTDELETKLQTALYSGTNAPDVVTLELNTMGTFSETGYLEDLNNYGATDVLEGQYDYLTELSTNSSGEVVGLSWQATPGGYWYRKDLALEYLGTDDPDEVAQFVTDWDTILETGIDVYEASGGETYMFASYSCFWYTMNKDGESWANDGVLYGADNLTDMYTTLELLYSNNVCSKLDAWSSGWADGMYNSDTYIFVGLPTWGLHYVIKSNTPEDEYEEAYDNWGLVEATSPYYSGGTWYCMISTSENKENAWAFIETMTSNEEYITSYLIEELGDFSSSVSANEYEIENEFTDDFLGDQVYFEVFDSIAEDIVVDPITEYDTKALSLFTANLDLVLNGDITIEEAVENWQTDMINAYPELSVE